VPEELEHDDDDTRALHAVIVHDDVALATGRLLSIAGGTGKIGRLAVKRSLRGQGLGRQVLTALLQAARQQGVKRIHLHAQCGAQAFYEAEGFKAVGEPFEEAGIDHILMVKAL
jgi:predicted GNAT family N-acyltransferase